MYQIHYGPLVRLQVFKNEEEARGVHCWGDIDRGHCVCLLRKITKQNYTPPKKTNNISENGK